MGKVFLVIHGPKPGDNFRDYAGPLAEEQLCSWCIDQLITTFKAGKATVLTWCEDCGLTIQRDGSYAVRKEIL